ncbi:hypothetical protein O1L60_14145 [Streptomyces diastatochromogenes]|nr:hypothetical protein [Streptomyces diastatochromogenes]
MAAGASGRRGVLGGAGAAYTERGSRLGDVRDYPRAELALRRSLAERPAARGNLEAELGLGALAGRGATGSRPRSGASGCGRPTRAGGPCTRS